MQNIEIKSDNWWDHPFVQDDISKSIELFNEYRNTAMCDDCYKLDIQFDALLHLLTAYKTASGNESQIDSDCICDLLDASIPEDRMPFVNNAINETGFENIREAFRTLNQICENEFEESENLYGILKKHRFKKLPDLNIEQQFKHISNYFHLTFVYQNIMKKKCEDGLSEYLKNEKKKAALTLMPLIEVIFQSVLSKKNPGTGI